MNHIVLLKNLLGLLKLGDYEIANEALLLKAANWTLNSNSFQFSEYKAEALKPILATLNNKNSTDQYLKPEPLSIKVSMPLKEKPDALTHFKDLKNALNKSSDENLLTTLEIFGSTLSVNAQYDDISLFDFIKTTVGIAACLQVGNGKLRLAGGGISGIQTYLYEIISKNAAKLLKGRSFYIQLLVDSALNELISDFDLSPCHVVYSSGGGFYVFMPDIDDLNDRFKTFSKKISESIYAKHKIALAIDLAMTDVFDEKAEVNVIWSGLFQKIGNLKYKRFENNDALFDDFFEKVEQGGINEKDPITNEEFDIDTDGKPIKVKLHEADDAKDANTIWVKPFTKSQIDLGRNLQKANFLINSSEKINGNTKKLFQGPFDTFHYLVEENTIGALAISINKIETGNPFIFYGGNKFPIHDNGDIKSFDELTENKDFSRLAILRMDVDDLGSIFSDVDKIKSKQYGLNWVRYVAVSRNLDLFFKGYLNELKLEIDPENETSVIIYSGGDDLFIVGRWDTMIAFAEAIYTKFKAWTNGTLTISGGLEILPRKFPIMQGAKMTAKSELKAKRHSIIVNDLRLEKNTITILGKSLNWEYEFTIVKELQEKLYDMITNKKYDKSIIHKIISHADAQFDYQHRKTSPRWMWIFAYDFSQIISRLPDEKNHLKPFLNQLKTASITNQYKGEKIKGSYPFLQLLQLAARCAELRNRANFTKNSI